MSEGERAVLSGSVGQVCGQSQAAPIDLDHLARQTMGDRALGREVLGLFVQQSLSVREQMAGAEPRQRVLLAHGLKGAARGIGAFAIADCADAIERNPDGADHLKLLDGLVEDVRAFVAAMNG
jgi:HPt (histidine-containing phosphotransfer) domain-containing protein